MILAPHLFLGSRSSHNSDPTDAAVREHLDPEVRDGSGHQELLTANLVVLARPQLQWWQQDLPVVRFPQQL